MRQNRKPLRRKPTDVADEPQAMRCIRTAVSCRFSAIARASSSLV